MEECKYCRELFTGDCNYCFFQNDVNLENGLNLFDINVFINDDKLELYVDTIDCTEICKSIIKINYCPMCGRRLVK